jgi:hypothetical protein
LLRERFTFSPGRSLIKTFQEAIVMKKDNTMTFAANWSIQDWILVLSFELTESEMRDISAKFSDVQKGRASSRNFNQPCWIYGKIFNHPDFDNNAGILTSRIKCAEMVDNSLYIDTDSGSRYRLEGGVEGIGIRDGENITVECIKDGKTCRYVL